jgi:hypothetical protein
MVSVGAQKSSLPSNPFSSSYSLSLSAGDVAFRVLEVIREQEPKPRETMGWGPWSSVVVCDINPAMLEVGKKRAKERGALFSFLKASVERGCKCMGEDI